MTGFLRRVLSPYRGLLILVILLQLGQSFLTMYLPTINSRLWCGECGCCIYHASGNSHAGNSSYPVSAINLGWYFRSKGGTDDRTGFEGAGL